MPSGERWPRSLNSISKQSYPRYVCIVKSADSDRQTHFVRTAGHSPFAASDLVGLGYISVCLYRKWGPPLVSGRGQAVGSRPSTAISAHRSAPLSRGPIEQRFKVACSSSRQAICGERRSLASLRRGSQDVRGK